MRNSRQPYYWPINKIVDEYKLIQEKNSDLSATQRKTVEYIYNTKLKKGLIPGQKEALTAEMDQCLEAASGVLITLCKSLGVEAPQTEHLEKFTLLLDYPTHGEIANYLVSIHGNFLGWIKVYKENNGYKAKYYVEEKEKKSGAKTFGSSPQKQRA